MISIDLSSKTVQELRAVARENRVKLGAGISKDGILQKLNEQLPDEVKERLISSGEGRRVDAQPPEPVQQSMLLPEEDAAAAEPAPEAPKAVYRSANTAPVPGAARPTPIYSMTPSYQAPSFQARQGYQSRTQRQQPNEVTYTQTRPTGFTPRFGPAAEETPFAPKQEETPFAARPQTRPAFGEAEEASPDTARQQRPYTPRPAYQPRTPGAADTTPPTINELLSPAECLDGEGVLEMHPDGYGFLRSRNFLPSSHDIYMATAQIRRFGLRDGDYVVGKVRPQRDTDKYGAMLYVTSVNGVPADEVGDRPDFEALTAVYPSKKIDLDSHREKRLTDVRLIDLLAPIGFGQRGLILCPPDTGKTEILQHIAATITENHPDVVVSVLLVDENPEDVTLFRDAVSCQVIATTFDQPPESHMRLMELMLANAERQVENGRDVVLIVDSLTMLAKTYTTASAQQGRSIPGMVNPASLFRAKKLFGAARSLREGGSLTVIGTMNIETASRVDDTIIEEFRGTANMELMLDTSIARAGIVPAFNIDRCLTKRAELLVSPERLEAMQVTRSLMRDTPPAKALPQLISMLETTDSNETFLSRVKDWAALIKKGAR